jgi:alginate O-acetyltransferase complex protein AlgI
MIFSSVNFLIFFSLVLCVYWPLLGLLPELHRNRARQWFLILASAYFYMSWNARFILVIYYLVIVDFLCGIRIEEAKSPGRRRMYLLISICMNLGMLVVFKYTNFFLGTFNSLVNAFGGSEDLFVDLILPVGISFHTFQSITYTVGVYRGTTRAARRFSDVALYVTFFPQLVAGPIVRANEFLPQLARSVSAQGVNVRKSVNFILMGLIKKVIISDHVSAIADKMFAAPSTYGTAGAWVGAVAFGIQIYGDFSGYSDVAIGTAGLLGYELPVNFNMPYIARNIAEFWRRWHISLSSWLRDYIYLPLGSNHRGRLMEYRNMLITMILCGFWHGASWTFVVWGALHGAALVVHNIYSRFLRRIRRGGRSLALLPNLVSWLLTSCFVCMSSVFFRSHSLRSARIVISRMVWPTGPRGYVVPPAFWAALAAMVCGHFLGVRYYGALEGGRRLVPRVLEPAAYAVVVFALVLFAPDGAQPFIYFQF